MPAQNICVENILSAEKLWQLLVNGKEVIVS